MRRAVVAVGFVTALGGRAGADPYELRAAIGNDAFTDLTPPLDDQGFTNDLAFAGWRWDGPQALGGSVLHRMITSRFGFYRWDQLDLRATALRVLRPWLDAAARLGPTLGGNFGGRWLQNGWHAWSGTGPTIEQGLQDTYDGDRRVGIVGGASVRAATWRGDLDDHAGGAGEGYGRLDGQLALGGTGVTSAELAAGGRGRAGHFDAHGELAVTRYHVGDANLALPGGYRAGWQLEWRVGIGVAWSRYRVSYEYRANEGGSGEPIGVLAFELRPRRSAPAARRAE